MLCKLVIDKIEDKKILNVNINEFKEPLQIMRQLAICYRETSKMRKNEKIKNCKAWETFDEHGGHVQKFRFEIVYNIDNKYIYEYTFTGCGLD